jgi:hypothetical protein
LADFNRKHSKLGLRLESTRLWLRRNAPTTDTSCKDLNNEPGLQGGFANGRGGKSIEQVDIIQDMSAMTDDGLII